MCKAGVFLSCAFGVLPKVVEGCSPLRVPSVEGKEIVKN